MQHRGLVISHAALLHFVLPLGQKGYGNKALYVIIRIYTKSTTCFQLTDSQPKGINPIDILSTTFGLENLSRVTKSIRPNDFSPRGFKPSDLLSSTCGGKPEHSLLVLQSFLSLLMFGGCFDRSGARFCMRIENFHI